MNTEQFFKKIYITESSYKDASTKEILKKYPNKICKVIPDNMDIENINTGYDPKQVLLLTQSKGGVVKGCPGTADSYLCCRYQVINHTMNCPLNCTYCILQFYLNQPATVIYTNFDEIADELRQKLDSQKNRFIRIGTGELGDSLALPGSRMFASKIVNLFREYPNAMFEIKSKLTTTDELFNLPHNGNIVFSWSLNPQEIVNHEESMADSILTRLEKAREAQKRGFLTGFHFDPILAYPDWENLYSQLIDQIYDYVDPAMIPWISMGSLRFPPSMKDKIIDRYPKTTIMYGEMIKGIDGKMRYARPVRIPIYKHIYNKLTDIKNPPFIYFCMENSLVWREVMGFTPETNAHLDWMFADSVYKRFNLIETQPDFKDYENALNLDGTEF